LLLAADSTQTVGVPPIHPGLLLGLILLAGIVGGYVSRLIYVPRVVGYLLAGLVLHAVLSGVLAMTSGAEAEAGLAAAAEPLNAVKDLALGVILFTVGGVFERSRVRSAGRRVVPVSLAEIALTAGLVFLGTLAAAMAIGMPGGATSAVILAALLGATAVETAPAATVFVLHEYESKGPATDTILSLIGSNNIACILLFHAVFMLSAAWGGIQTTGPLGGHLWLALLSTTLGSLVLGVACGVMLSLVHARLALTETLLIFFAMFVLLGGAEKWLLTHGGVSFNFLLTALTIGGVFANVAIDPQKLATALRTMGAPLFVAFFVLAGYSLHIADLLSIGWVGAVYIVCRTVGKAGGALLGIRWSRSTGGVNERVAAALLCQAAVSIGLVAFAEQQWADPVLARRFGTIVLGSIVVFEMAGPLLVKWCVVHCGEVKASTLLRRAGRPADTSSVFRLTITSLGRLVGVSPSTGSRAPSGPMLVDHIMRRNVQLIPSSATFDDVLHFIERSTHSHFPVVDEEGKAVGVIHFSDVQNVIYDPATKELVTALDLADPDSAVVPLGTPLTELLEVFRQHDVAVLPVVSDHEGRNVVGLVEQRDLLKALHKSTG
jgi:CBS domain-containing protein